MAVARATPLIAVTRIVKTVLVVVMKVLALVDGIGVPGHRLLELVDVGDRLRPVAARMISCGDLGGIGRAAEGQRRLQDLPGGRVDVDVPASPRAPDTSWRDSLRVSLTMLGRSSRSLLTRELWNSLANSLFCCSICSSTVMGLP